MTASKADSLGVAGETLLSLVIGSSLTLVLAILRAQQIMPEIADVLLRPGPYITNKLGLTGAGGILLSVVGDGLVFGAAAFALMRLRSARRKPRSNLALHIERRRALRLPLKRTVFVYGWSSHEPFSEITETLNVSATGGLIVLSAKVIPAQKLILINADSNEEMACRVARSVSTDEGKNIIGFEFPEVATRFWQAQEQTAPDLADATAQTGG
ncbi:MAG TPA: PilZ domain-containing protein [Candidatus Aquilonibacter sp.]|nr:PilZ domain-containing protein [Candidatus Aquilonibacter sp.]